MTENVTVHVVFVAPFMPVTVICNASRQTPVKLPLTRSNGVDDERTAAKQPLLQPVTTMLGGLTTPFTRPLFAGQPDCAGAWPHDTGWDS